jgi:asparagine synthase (glutamine-hydrolysing)
MCGIAGIVYRDPRHVIDRELLERMARTLAHRGPDDESVYIADGVGLAMRRLSIIDIAGGRQPLSEESGEILVMQNGEIYNYLELQAELRAAGHTLRTNSDTEVVAHLYEADPRSFAARLNGMFALVVFDRRTRTVTLARDRFGKKPLYVHEDGERVVFASELKALLDTGLVARRLDQIALHDYLTFNFVPLPRTIVEGIRHVPPATCATIVDGRVTERRFWRLAPERVSAEDTGERIRDLVTDSVALRLRADVPVGVYLSGGVDSSSTAWAVSRKSEKPVRAFTIGFDALGFDETGDAAAVATALGLPIEIMRSDADLLADLPAVMRYADQPHGDASFLPMLELARAARRHVKVVLSGEGADEIFGGYPWHASAPYNTRDRWEDVRRRVESNAVFRQDEKRALYTSRFPVDVASHDSAELVRDTLASAPELDPTNETLFVDLTVLLPGNNLVKADRMGMSCGLELRCPFMDYRLVELAFGIPGDRKIRDGVGKIPLREAMAGVLPESAAWREKRMFAVPMTAWLRERMRPQLEALVAGDAPITGELLSGDELRRLVDEHRSGRADHTRKLRALVALDVWARGQVEAATSRI